MTKQVQLSLFQDFAPIPADLKAARSGSFVDNMALPIHRWFRYSAGFSAEWVEQLLEEWQISPEHLVLDPFAGSGTVPLACEKLGLKSIGIEAHPVVARICKAKLFWPTPVQQFADFAEQIQTDARRLQGKASEYPPLIQRSFEPELLAYLDALKAAWLFHDDHSPASELVWLVITAILRVCSSAGTAQWQYILPKKTKKKVVHPATAFRQQVEMMQFDMHWMQSRVSHSHASLIVGDARDCADNIKSKVDAVVTSPPYANNYDYADALRFEMTFWGEVNGWGDIHDKVRKYLIVSSSQHSSKERLAVDDLLSSPAVEPIRSELAEVVDQLAAIRENHGGKKHYHTMVAAYCRDIAMVSRGLRAVCRRGAHMCWVIGDSAPYGVYCPIDRWIGELALAEGFVSYEFEKLRDRNTRWKNRKHQVPLKEGLLWIEG
ncbi:MAG: DNA modification methylase [Chloroflexi bacterium]|nr:MAG: DNA modification methylase [Chloroflexota bacterium]